MMKLRRGISIILASVMLVVAIGTLVPTEVVASEPTIVFGETYAGSIGNVNHKEDTYILVMKESGELNVNADSTGAIAIEIRKYSSVDYQIYSDFVDNGETSKVFLEKGIYYLDVENRVGYYGTQETIVNYEISFGLKPSNETYTYSNNSFDDLQGVNAISFNTKINGLIAQNDDRDIYKMVLPSSGKITINTQAKMGIVGLSLYDANNEEKPLDETNCFSSRDNIEEYHLSSGTYYLYYYKVSSYSYTTIGNYQFSVNFVPSKETYTYNNNTVHDLGRKSAIPFDKRINGQLAKNDGVDIYKIKVPLKGKLIFKLNSSMEEGDYILTTSQGKELGRGALDTSKSKNTWNVGKGVYYIKFCGYRDGGNYNFNLSFSPNVNKPAKFAVVNKKGQKLRITAKKKGSISGYELRYKQNGSKWKKTVLKGNKNYTKTIKNLKKNKKYSVKLRAYYKYKGKTYYSGWTSTKVIKIKK